jgi:hypothetical protein
MTPSAALQRLVDDCADAVLFGRNDVDVPVMAMRELVLDLMSQTEITDPLLVQRRLITEFVGRLDDRLRAMVDDGGGERWRKVLQALEGNFPSLH